MGGDCWSKRGPYEKDLAVAFRRAQDRELAADDHGFPGRSITELWEDEGWQEYILTGGTCTVLDFCLFADAEDGDSFAMMRPLTEAEVRSWAPGGRPTRAQWEAVSDRELFAFDRGVGRCTVLYRDGEPAEIVYWGITYY